MFEYLSGVCIMLQQESEISPVSEFSVILTQTENKTLIYIFLLLNNNFDLFPSRRRRPRVTRASSEGRELRQPVPDFSRPAQLRPHPPGRHLVFIAPGVRNPTGMDCPDWTTGRPTLQPLPLKEHFLKKKKKKENTDNLSVRKRERTGLRH